MNNEPYCLVLGGGGAKGVYHIGVWQALKEMNIPVHAFIGNSIGAVISAFLAQGAEEELLDIARSMNIASLIRLNEGKALADEESIRQHSLSYWQGVYQNVVSRKGLDTSPMRELLESGLNEDDIRNSGIDFGVTTVNLSDFKPREVFIEEMEPGQLINYVMASAAFPGFQQPEIEGKKYLDGGLYDNVPYTMAKRRGYRKVILVDISGIGFNRRPKTEGMQTVYIKNSIDMGNAFDFDPEFIKNFWELGYLDTLKTFGKLVGYQYFIEPNQTIESNWLTNYTDTELFVKSKELKATYPEQMRHDRRHILKTLEVCADLLEVNRIEKYSYQSLMAAIQLKIDETKERVEALLEQHDLKTDTPPHKVLDAFIKDIIQKRKISDNPYFYYLLIRNFKTTKTLQFAETTVMKLNPELSILIFFIEFTSQQRLA